MIDVNEHASEFRRCLLELDLDGITKIWRHVAPHLAEQSPKDTMISIHIARCEMKYIPKKAKTYSEAWLADLGYRKIDGKWVEGLPPPAVYADSVGISSRSASGYVLPLNQKIMTYMEDALLNTMAKGITEPRVQKENMMKAREKVRHKARLA